MLNIYTHNYSNMSQFMYHSNIFNDYRLACTVRLQIVICLLYWDAVLLFLTYRIMQIIHGGKLSRFSRISLQSRMFSSKFFLSIIRCFELLYNRESFPANSKKDHTTATLFHRELFALQSGFTYNYFSGRRYIVYRRYLLLPAYLKGARSSF